MEGKNKTSKSNVNCCVVGCKSVRKDTNNLMYHAFPKPDEKIEVMDEFGIVNLCQRRKIWEINLRMEKKPSNYMTVCSRHFKEEDYICSGWNTRKRLLSRAVPTENLPDTSPDSSLQKNLIQNRESANDEQLNDSNSDDMNNEDATSINQPKFEEIYIKEEPPEETEDSEDVLQSVEQEECVNNNEQIDKDYIPPTTNNNRRTKSVKPKSFPCEVCNKIFSRQQELRRHMLIHQGIKEFVCHVCKKSFTQSGNLFKHMKIHYGIKDFQCTICNKQFTQSSNLYTHMKVHSDAKEHKCLVCGKPFRLSTHLKTHMKIHNRINSLWN